MAVNKNMRILVVDDFKTMQKIVVNLLRQIGFENVATAADGTEALEKLKGDKFDFILSDWNMEPMDGLQFLKHVRADERYKALPFIMITAESKIENIVTAKKAGVNNYIVKPFNAPTLKEKMASVIGPF